MTQFTTTPSTLPLQPNTPEYHIECYRQCLDVACVATGGLGDNNIDLTLSVGATTITKIGIPGNDWEFFVGLMMGLGKFHQRRAEDLLAERLATFANAGLVG